MSMNTVVAMYKGDDFLFEGTIEECAAHRNVKPETIYYYTTPAYERKLAKRKTRNPITVIRLDDDLDDEDWDEEDNDI